jgi:hypothetical protein
MHFLQAWKAKMQQGSAVVLKLSSVGGHEALEA